jgi:hypothetical protein
MVRFWWHCINWGRNCSFFCLKQKHHWPAISQMFIGWCSWCISLIFSKSWMSSSCHCRPAA